VRLFNWFYNLSLKEDYGIQTAWLADLPKEDLWPVYPSSEMSRPSCLLLILSVTHTHMQTMIK